MKTVLLLNLVFWSILFVVPCAYAEPDIEVESLFHSFGEVEVGLSETVMVTIKNVGTAVLP